MPKRPLFATAVLAFALWGAPARADDQSDLAKARAAYEAKNYQDADRRLHAMLDPETGTLKDAYLRTQARMYLGATLLAEKKQAEAIPIFEALLLEDPSFEPDPLSFPTEVVDAFIDMRKRMVDKINATKAEHARQAAERKTREEDEKRKAAEHVRLLERLATEEKVTERHSRWIAMIPFGVGQFQNGQTTLGWIFLGSEAAMLIGAGVAFPVWYYNRSHVNALVGRDPDLDPLKTYRDRANAASIANGIFNGAFALTAAIGILHAQLTFVPEKVEVKKRPLPTVGLSPVIAPQQGGGIVGLTGRF